MKQYFKKSAKTALVAVALCSVLVLGSAWNSTIIKSAETGDPIPGVTNLVNATYASVDAETENYIPSNRVYNRHDALLLKESLEKQLESNPTSLALNFALVKFHANAPNFSGGYKGSALQYAANIYRLNSYVGCLAFEYIYTKNYDFKNAETWYKNSLISRLNEGFEWREVKYTSNAPFGVGVVGPFSNGRVQPLYLNVWGSYSRKIMIPKCTGDCLFTLIPDFLKGSKEVRAELVFVNW